MYCTHCVQCVLLLLVWVRCRVLIERGVLRILVMSVICVLCLIAVLLPPGKNLFAVQLNNVSKQFNNECYTNERLPNDGPAESKHVAIYTICGY
jgi:hypothetical protein